LLTRIGIASFNAGNFLSGKMIANAERLGEHKNKDFMEHFHFACDQRYSSTEKI
jgi:hypothetical protein